MLTDQKSSLIRLEGLLRNLAVIRGFVSLTCASLDIDPDATADVVVAVDELATNIILHGYQEQNLEGGIEIEIVREKDTLIVWVRDQAPAFDPHSVEAPDLSVPLEERSVGGIGIYLTRQVIDEVLYKRLPEGMNEITLKKKCGAAS